MVSITNARFAALADAAREELAATAFATRPWVHPRHENGTPMLDVAIIGGGPGRYEAALAHIAALRGAVVAKADVLAIGDGAPTDLKGAKGEDLDILFVTGGIHAANFGPTEQPDSSAVARFLSEEQLAARAFLPHLQW